MFGLSHKITDTSLYLLHDMVEGMLHAAEEKLRETPKDKLQEISELEQTIAYYNRELRKFEYDIEEQRKQHFQFSIEELYNMFGQYDKFVGIEFHKLSESAKKFGRNIGGTFIYGKNERKKLQQMVNSGDFTRTKGTVKLEVTSNYDLSREQLKELMEIGFNSGDIYQISDPNSPVTNAYTQKGRKEIPNTINISFDPADVDPCKLSLYNLHMRLSGGGKLIDAEWNKYYGYNLYFSPEIKDNPVFKSKIYNPDGSQNNEVRFYELVAKQRNFEMREAEIKEFSGILKNRRIERFEVLKDELKKTGINSLEKFKDEHPEIYKEIYKTALVFDDEALNYTKASIPIFWNFRTYLHIFLRHCDELQPSGNFKTKTPFPYNQKDIRRMLSIAVEQLHDEIQERLSKGLDFRIYGEKALYFNGNYYSLRIENTGRIDSFYPNENIE